MKPPRAVRLLNAVFAAAGLAALGRAEVIERVVVRVNADILTQTEFEARQVAAVQAARVPPSGVETYLRENNSRLLQEAIDELLIVQRGAELGIKVSSGYLNQVLDSIRKENNIASEAELVQQLRREGMTLGDLKRNIERSVVRQEVLRAELQGKIKVTEAEARAEYEAKKADYTRAASVHLMEIVLPKTATREQAEDMARRARAGEDFASLARAHSAGPTRESGGDLGRLSEGDLAPALEGVAFALPPGAVSDPLPVPDGGWRVLKVVEKTAGHVVPFAEVKDQILDRLRQTRASERYEAYVEGLRKAAVVELKVREVPLQVTLPAEAGQGGAPALGSGTLGPPRPSGDGEFSVSPQVQPERVAPPPLPGASPTPAPTPSPSPPAQ